MGFSIERVYRNLPDKPDRAAIGVRFQDGVGGSGSEYLRAHIILRPVSPIACLKKNERVPPHVNAARDYRNLNFYGSEQF